MCLDGFLMFIFGYKENILPASTSSLIFIKKYYIWYMVIAFSGSQKFIIIFSGIVS